MREMTLLLNINAGTVVVVLILVLIVGLAVKNSLGHFKGEGGCCGGGGGSIRPDEKKLDGPVIGTKTVKIEGMHCENCRNSVERAVDKIEGASCRVNLKKNIAEIKYDREIPDETIKNAIERLDFKVTEILQTSNNTPQ